MTLRFKIFPAHAAKPLIRAHGNGIVFSTVFHREEEHGLQLIHIPDGETVYIPLTEEYRVGKVYSVSISPFDADEWAYRYRSGDLWVIDPLAFSVRKTRVIEDGSQKEIRACICSPLRAENLFSGAPERPLPPVRWEDQLVYGIHVKGFTAAQPESFPGRGTFAGVISMIPYLRDLGVTAVELMPVYLPLPDLNRGRSFRTMQEALGAWPVSPQGDPMRDLKERPNYWGYGRGLYCALRPEYGSQQDFAKMVSALHRAGIRVLLQIDFEKGISEIRQIDLLRFYVDRYGVDGFRLLGCVPSIEAIASAPSLSETALFYDFFPFQELQEAEEAGAMLYEQDIDTLFPEDLQEEESRETGLNDNTAGSAHMNAEKRGGLRPVRTSGRSNPARHSVSFSNLVTCGGDFQTLLRRFVKSDDYVMKDFLKLFLSVSERHGQLRTVTGFDGFTLADLVSYNERHNEANGEFGLDGQAENYSWNCGVEGPSRDHLIVKLRRKQMRNLMTLLMLAQGTPLIRQGDERCNTQDGNNNPYCQDNPISWIDWQDSAEGRALTGFTARLIDFRRNHPVFRSRRPFQYIDYYGIGHPDVSLHGAEAWKPDLGAFSHSIGICYCENYADDHFPGKDRKSLQAKGFQPSFVYLAVNMYWEELSLALPKIPPHYMWKVFMDTEKEEGFLERPVCPYDQHKVSVSPRSIKILRAVPDMDSIARERNAERLEKLPPVGAVLRDLRRSRDPEAACGRHSAWPKTPARVLRRMKKMIRPSTAHRSM